MCKYDKSVSDFEQVYGRLSVPFTRIGKNLIYDMINLFWKEKIILNNV